MSQCELQALLPQLSHVLIDRRETDSHLDRQPNEWFINRLYECPDIAKLVLCAWHHYYSFSITSMVESQSEKELIQSHIDICDNAND